MALEQIASNIDAAHAQFAYYALQEKFNIGWAINQLIAISLPLLLFFTGLGSSVYAFLIKRLKLWTIATFIYFFSIIFVVSICQSLVIHHMLTIRAELDGSDVPPLLPFVASQLPSAVLTSSLAALAGIVLCYILRRKNKLTWLWLSIVVSGLLSITLMLAPYFSNTQPLGNTPTENKIAALAARAGIPRGQIAKEDCANSPDCPPGHVVGIGPTRVMLLDNRLTRKTPEDQLIQVVAHEAKHYLLDNGIKPFATIFMVCIAVCLLTQMVFSPIGSRQSNRDNSLIAQAKSVPLVYGLGLAIFILLQPAITTYRRHVEFEADRFGLEFNKDNQALIEIMRVDATSNPMLLKYTPITKYFRATHPDISTRIEFAQTYQPWLHNQPMVYKQYFKE
ncbi:MAG: M48 family metalloprotease [Pseudoxanthomonas sp.]